MTVIKIAFPQGFVALDRNVGYAPAVDADGKLYLRTDIERTSPLPIEDYVTGASLDTAHADTNGVVQPIVATADVSTGDDLTLVWVSGNYNVPVQSVASVIAFLQPKLDAAQQSAAQAVEDISESVDTVSNLSTQVQNALAALVSDNDGGKVTDPPVQDPTILVSGTAAEWASSAYVLAAAQPGFATDTGELKVGDGTRAWDDLPAITGEGGGDVTASDITDATVTGRALIRASSAEDAAGVLALGWLLSGAGNPTGVVAAPVGSVYARTDGGSNSSLYVKESGTGAAGWVAYGAAQTKASLGLGNVDNTSDADKPISTATQTALDRRTVDYWADEDGHWGEFDPNDQHRRLHSTHIATADIPNSASLKVGDQWYAHPDQQVA